jgi:hypothetical protein
MATKKMLDVIKDLADDTVDKTVDTVVDAGVGKLNPLLDELLALKEEIASVRKAIATSKGELTRFKNEISPRLDSVIQTTERLDRLFGLFRFLKKIPLVNRLF